MKKLLTILLIIFSVVAFGQNQTGKQYIPWLRSDAITITGAGGVENPGYFIWHGDTIDFNILSDSTIVFKSDSTILFVTLSQMMDSLLALPGGHDPATIGTAGTTAGLSITGQVINMQSATASRNGYLTSGDFSNFFNKLTTVTHDNTLKGLGTSAFPLSADTAIMAARAWVLSQNYINENQLHWDSITNKPTIPQIEDIAYGITWDGDLDGASKNAIYDKIESLAGGHDILTLGDTALAAGLKLYGQELEFQPATSSQNGYLTSTDWQKFNTYVTDSAGILRWTDTLNTTKGIATPYDLTTGLATKEPVLTKGNLTENIPGLQFSATRQVIGGAAELQLSSGYSIPTTAQLTRANNHVTNDADTLLNNEKSYKFLVGTVTGTNINVNLPEYTVANYDILTVLPDNDITGADSITLSVNSGTQNKIFELTSIDSDYAYNLVYYNSEWFFWLGRMAEESSVAGNNTGDQNIDTFRIASNTLELSLSGDGEPKKTVDLSPYLDDQTVTINNGLGINVSGTYPTFTAAVDTANASILSRQRAANTYQPKGSYLTSEVDGSTTNELQNLTYNSYPDKGIMLISSGAGDTIPVVTSVNAGLMTPGDKNKLDSANYFIESDLVSTVEYGALYNYYAATDSRKISSSDDWVVPSRIQFATLADEIDIFDNDSTIWPLAGGKLKETGTLYWNIPNEGATNEFGFNAKGSGLRYSDFLLIKEFLSIWNIDSFDSNSAYCSQIINSSSILFSSTIYSGYTADKYAGQSIRLLYVGSGTPTEYVGNDGKRYRIVQIGSQYWLADNLAETKYRNGDWITGFDGGVYTPIADAAWAALTTEAMCYYDDTESYGGTLAGGLVEVAFGDTINISDYETDPIYTAEKTAINDTLSSHNTRLLAVEGLDTTGVYHANRALLDAITASDTTRWGTVGNYIQNQNSASQTANFYINGRGYFGTSTGLGSVDPMININRTLTGSGNSHAYTDGTTFTKDAGTAYNSYDAKALIGGTNNYDHYAGFQSAPTYQGTGTTTYNYGLYTYATINSGTITNNYGVYTANPIGAGTITSNVGVYVANQTKGTNDYGVYIQGADTYSMYVQAGKSYFGGNTRVADKFAIGTTDANTENLLIRGSGTQLIRLYQTGYNYFDIQSPSAQTYFTFSDINDIFQKFNTNAGIELYYNGGKKIETTNTGVTVNGTIQATTGRFTTIGTGTVANLIGVTSDGTLTTAVQIDTTDVAYLNEYVTLRTTDFITEESQTLSLDSTATKYIIGLTDGDTISFLKNTGGTNEINGNLFLSGIVSGRNIDITYPDYTPADGDLITVLPDDDIANGDTITLSVNGGEPKAILDYYEHDEDYLLELVYLTDYWGLLGRKAEEYTVKGINTGDQDLTPYLKKNDEYTTYSSNGITLTNVNFDNLSDSTLVPKAWVLQQLSLNNTTPQTLVGVSPYWNTLNGLNAVITLSGATNITMANLIPGQHGMLTVNNGGSTSYLITFAGYTFKIHDSIRHSANKVLVSGGTTVDLFSWYYDGSVVLINGGLNFN